MAIYRMRNLSSICSSSDPRDRQIAVFALKNNIRRLSYKDYKYLYCLLCVEEISLAVGGSPMQEKEKAMRLWLEAARLDRRMELTKKAIRPSCLQAGLFRKIKPVLEKELRPQKLSLLLEVREEMGAALSKLFVSSVKGEAHEQFWKNITTAMLLLDTLADLFKDRAEGLLKKIDLRGVALLLRKLAKSSVCAVRHIGLFRSIRLLFHPVVMTIKGGFESETAKEKQREIFPAAPMESTPKAYECQAPGCRT
ncbi:MAG: hypothetical protein N3E51_01170 [Candidatus Micrarchaeota archaeon]|nr:hypothetical protein [Candidatus Micrarchaeota archaeon]